MLEPISEATAGLADAAELYELASAENDTAALTEIAKDVARFEAFAETLEFQRMFSGEMDTGMAKGER